MSQSNNIRHLMPKKRHSTMLRTRHFSTASHYFHENPLVRLITLYTSNFFLFKNTF